MEENRVGDDIVQKFGDFSIGDEAEETPQESVFAFLDSPSFQERSESDINYGLFQMAMNPQGYKNLKQYLDLGMYVQETFDEVYPHIFKLMSDVRGAQIFESLLGFCNTDMLCAIMVKFVSERKEFFSTALCKSGSKSIQAFALRLVDPLRGPTGLEGSLTGLLAEFACVIMTHTYGWHIFEQCFAVLGDGPNQILYGWVIALFDKLAVEPAGYLVINAAMNSVRGYFQRDLLLLVIKNAAKLSGDKYGNFVVQHCLNLRDEVVNRNICDELRGRFVELAQKEGGSYVVEICLEFSDYGRKLVLAEILKDARTLEMLARDRLGNYVVQVALEVTRIRDQNTYYKMVKVLQPRCSDAIRNAILGKRRGKCSHYMSHHEFIPK